LVDLEAVEMALRRAALSVAARAVQTRLNQDHSDRRLPDPPCPLCGRAARYVERRTKTFVSVLGPLKLERAYFHCTTCGSGFFPRDRALGLSDSTLTPAVTRMVGAVGATVSFEEGRQLLHELAAVTLDARTVQRVAEALGAEIALDERTLVERTAPSAPTLYLGLDGTGIPMRKAELAGRHGKQPDGSSKTREVKLCTVWSAERRDKNGLPERDPGSVSYSAAIESAATLDTQQVLSAFALRVQRETDRRGFPRARRRVILGDGAAWIWNIADAQFPDAVQIVDRFHVKQHLCDVAKAISGPASKMATDWARARHTELDQGRLDDLIHAIQTHAPTCEEARKCIGYLERNRDRMNYPDLHARGLSTSSGVVEAGCKVAIGTRLKRAGMHWTIPGADAVIALRCCRLSNRFEDFWERRAA
jgi:hypothetical protein